MGKGLSFGIPFVRQLAPLYIKRLVSPTSAYNQIRAKYPLDVSRKVFFEQYNEIRDRFSFRPLLARLPDTAVPRVGLVTRTDRVLANRYEYRLAFDYKSGEEGKEITRFATIYSDKRISLRRALADLKALQEKLTARDPRYKSDTYGYESDEDFLRVQIAAINQTKR